MGRKKLGSSQKQAAVHVRMTKSEYNSLAIMAGQEQRNLSAMLRELVREGAQTRGVLSNLAALHRGGIHAIDE